MADETQDEAKGGDWEMIDTTMSTIGQFRQRVPGGWLVLCTAEGGCTSTFLPDPDGAWSPPIKTSRKRNDFFG